MRKFERQGEILRLVKEQRLGTQAELAEALRASGIDAVQTTISRDVAELGLVKVRDEEGHLVYALPGVGEVRGRGLLLGAELDRPTGPVVDLCRERGLLVGTAGERVLRVTPPLTIAREELVLALEIVAEALA